MRMLVQLLLLVVMVVVVKSHIMYMMVMGNVLLLLLLLLIAVSSQLILESQGLIPLPDPATPSSHAPQLLLLKLTSDELDKDKLETSEEDKSQ